MKRISWALQAALFYLFTLMISCIPARFVPHAGRLLSHHSWNVRIACARTVALLPTDTAGNLLAQALETESNELVRTQLQSLLKGLA